MEDYRPAVHRWRCPNLQAQWNGRGGSTSAGAARLSGPIPGGSVRGWRCRCRGGGARRRGLSLYDGCQTLRFDQLQLSNFTSERQAMTLCPRADEPMVRQGPRGLVMAARLAGATRLQGQLGSSDHAAGGRRDADRLSRRSAAVRCRSADRRGGAGTHIKAGDFSVDLGGTLAGRYADAEATIGVVPLLLTRGSGSWSFADSVLGVAGDEWLLRDRQVPARFQPLVSTDMRLTLADGRIAVTGTLDEPQTRARCCASPSRTICPRSPAMPICSSIG